MVGAEGAVPAAAKNGAEVARLDRAAVDKLRQLVAAYKSARAGVAQAQAELGRVRDANSAAHALRQERQQIEARLAEATTLYETHERRAGATLGRSVSPLGLAAPERIRIIDEPRDPVAPMTSIFKILVAFMVAGVAIGIGLAGLAEKLDGRIYSPSAFAELTGLPLVTSWPKRPLGETPAEAEWSQIATTYVPLKKFARVAQGAAE
jgi:uncharacterized protein involved in exopolysaccharide biosynthesis